MFWTRLKELCASRKKSVSAVCSEINLSNAVATKWKHGSIPNGETLQRLAEYFGCTVDYLIANSDSDSDRELMFALYGDVPLDEEVIKAVRKFAEDCILSRDANATA